MTEDDADDVSVVCPRCREVLEDGPDQAEGCEDPVCPMRGGAQ